MKKLILLSVFISGCVFGSPYAQLSSPDDQSDDGLVSLTTVDGISRISHDGDGTVVIEESGTYMIIAAPQMTRISQGQQEACGNFWVRHNSSDVGNSNVRLCLGGGDTTDVVVTQGALKLEEGDTIQLRMALDGAVIDAITTAGQPLIPSVIFTIYRL